MDENSTCSIFQRPKKKKGRALSLLTYLGFSKTRVMIDKYYKYPIVFKCNCCETLLDTFGLEKTWVCLYGRKEK